MKDSAVSKTLRKLSRVEAFYFFTSIGNYTGVSAASLEEFVEKIREVNIKSLEFHLYRWDFEKWATEVLEDEKLAEQIKSVRTLGVTGDALRDQLYFAVLNRIEELKSQIPPFS